MGLIDAMAVGLTVWRLGAGRSVPGERVQSGAGLRIHRRPGEPVAAGEALFTLYTDTRSDSRPPWPNWTARGVSATPRRNIAR